MMKAESLAIRFAATMTALFIAFGVGSGGAAGQLVVTEIIDANGDGAGDGLAAPCGIAVDGDGNVYVTGFNTDNAFKITPVGVITEIIDMTGDGEGNGLVFAEGIAAGGISGLANTDQL